MLNYAIIATEQYKNNGIELHDRYRVHEFSPSGGKSHCGADIT